MFDKYNLNQVKNISREKIFENEMLITDPKRRRVDSEQGVEMDGMDLISRLKTEVGLKKLVRGGNYGTCPSTPMSLITWNCCWLGNPRTVRFSGRKRSGRSVAVYWFLGCSERG